MNESTRGTPVLRFVVRELGPRCFVVEDTATTFSYDIRFTKKAAQEAADRRNARLIHPGSPAAYDQRSARPGDTPPGETHMNPTRPLNAAVKAEVAANYNGLPHARITEHDGAAHVFTTGLPELELWWLALGGRITHQPAGDGAALWRLHTDTDNGQGAPVVVHALALDTDQIDPDIAPAVA